MTDRTCSLGVVVFGMLTLACTAPESLDSDLNAALVQTCAPWDGPAVALFLTDRPPVATYPAPPYSSIVIYRSISEITGRRFTVGPDSQNVGSAQGCPAAGECRQATGASVTFSGLGADSTVEVEYRIELGPGHVVAGRARARYSEQTEFCG